MKIILFQIVCWNALIFGGAANTLAAETIVLMLGDSLTAGYGVEQSEAFPALVERRLEELRYTDVKIVAAGFSGSTSASALGRLRWYLRIKPDILFLELGGNDGLRGLDLETTKKNLQATIQLALDKGMAVVLAGMKIPPNYGQEYTWQFERIYPDLANKFSIPLIPFLLARIGGKPEFNLPDAIHPNPDGHKIVAETVLKHLLPLLGKPVDGE